MRKFTLLALLLASPLFGQNQTADSRTAAGCGPLSMKFDVKTDKKQHAMPQPDAGKALVYVIEEEEPPTTSIQLGHVTTRVGVDGNWVGANHGNSYLSFAVESGDHRVCSDWQSVMESIQKQMSEAANLTAQAGKTYYFRVKVWVGDYERPPFLKLAAVDEAEGQLLVSKSALSTS